MIVVSELAEGEVEFCFRGCIFFIRYFTNTAGTANLMDDKTYIHSGYLGCIDDEELITIKGRENDLIITAGR